MGVHKRRAFDGISGSYHYRNIQVDRRDPHPVRHGLHPRSQDDLCPRHPRVRRRRLYRTDGRRVVSGRAGHRLRSPVSLPYIVLPGDTTHTS